MPPLHQGSFGMWQEREGASTARPQGCRVTRGWGWLEATGGLCSPQQFPGMQRGPACQAFCLRCAGLTVALKASAGLPVRGQGPACPQAQELACLRQPPWPPAGPTIQPGHWSWPSWPPPDTRRGCGQEPAPVSSWFPHPAERADLSSHLLSSWWTPGLLLPFGFRGQHHGGHQGTHFCGSQVYVSRQ